MLSTYQPISATRNQLTYPIAKQTNLRIMKTFYPKNWLRFTAFLLLLCLSQCQKKDVTPTETVLTDPNEISKVMVIPGATLEKGSPPAITNTYAAPVLTTSTPDVVAISGQEATFSLNYSAVDGNITTIYFQIEGSDYYFKIPISTNSGSNGTINIPFKIPETVVVPNQNYVGQQKYSLTTSCCFAATSKGAVSKLCGNKFTSLLPPASGKSKVSINNSAFEGTALCDLDFAPYGKGYAIMIGQDQAIVLYNLKPGLNLLGNFEGLIRSSIYTTAPFAYYVNGSTSVYGSVSGTANVSGKTVSTSMIVKKLGDNQQISIGATGNCQ